MRAGKINTQGIISADTWERIYDNILTEAATSLTISGLAGDTDEEYQLQARIVNGYNGSSEYRLRPNNDTGTNYGYQYLIGSNTAATAARGTDTGIYIGGIDALGNLLQDEIKLQAKSGYIRTAIQENASPISGTTITNVKLLGWSWNNTADEITSLVIVSSQTNGLGIGTQITLWRRSKKV